MPAFIDARCRKCNTRIGWFGKMTDMPACHRCGAEPDRAALESDQAKMDDLRKRRLAAGLTLTPVADRLRVSAATVSGWERGVGKPNDLQSAILDELYGGA